MSTLDNVDPSRFRGFAESSRSYFNKDLKDINLPKPRFLLGSFRHQVIFRLTATLSARLSGAI